MKLSHPIPLALALLALAGCGKTGSVLTSGGPGPGGSDPAAYVTPQVVAAQVTAEPSTFEYLTYDDGDAPKSDMSAGAVPSPLGVQGTGAVTDAEIQPAFWFRHIREHSRTFEVQFDHPDSDTTLARVRVTDRLLGSFNIVTLDTTGTGEILRHLISKPLGDTGHRRAIFERHRIHGDDDAARTEDMEDGYRDGWSRWHLVALSGAEITSDNGTRTIESVRLQSGDVDVTITDPLELQRFPGGLVHLPPAVPVMITVKTGAPDDVAVLYARWGRMRLHPQQDGSYVGRFLTPALGGLRHIAVNALSHGTLYDDVAPYDSKAWGIPFVVGAPDMPLAAQ